jgi:hypothetical protein
LGQKGERGVHYCTPVDCMQIQTRLGFGQVYPYWLF